MLETIKRGIPRYNFLGIQKESLTRSDGVLRFKQNFDGYIVRRLRDLPLLPKSSEIQTDFSHCETIRTFLTKTSFEAGLFYYKRQKDEISRLLDVDI